MKNTRKEVAVVVTAVLFAFVVTSCDNGTGSSGTRGGGTTGGQTQDVARAQSATISLFGGERTATVKGTMTNAQWTGVADKILNQLELMFEGDPANLEEYKKIFARGVIFIVEVKPDGFTNIKTIGDGKTIHIALDKVDTAWVQDAVVSIYLEIGTVGGIEFRVENAADRAAVQTAFDTFKGADDGATSLATLATMDINFNKVIITGIVPSPGDPIFESTSGGILKGKLAEDDMDLVNFMVGGHFDMLL